MFSKVCLLLLFLHPCLSNPASSTNCECARDSTAESKNRELSETFQQFVSELAAIRNSSKPAILQCGANTLDEARAMQNRCDCDRYDADIRRLNETVQQLVAEAVTTISGVRLGGFCRVPNFPQSNHVTTNLAGGTRVAVGESITYTCDQGYWIAEYEVGKLVVGCRRDQNWTDAPPTCEPGRCLAGLKDGRIRNDQISALGYLAGWLPTFGRLDRYTAFNEGTWHPAENYTGSWLQVDFLTPTRVVGVITQGHRRKNWWIDGFKIAYGPKPSSMEVIQNHFGGDKVFQVHVDSGDTHYYNRFPQAVTARYFRLIVMSYVNNTPCLRMEYLLC